MDWEPKRSYTSDLRTTTVVMFVALAIGMLFNADVFKVWDERKDVGETRDQLIAATKEYRDWASAWGLTAPYEGIKAGFEVIADWESAPDSPQLAALDPGAEVKGEIQSATKSGMPAKKLRKKSRRKPDLMAAARKSGRVLVAGDSMMHGALGKELKRQINESKLGEPFVRSAIATGLARPDYFDWPKEMKRLYTTGLFGAAIVMLGGNDTQNIQVGRTKYTFGSAGWEKVYRERVRGLGEYICQSTPKLFWVGAPLMRPKRYNSKVQLVNRIVKDEVEKLRCGLFVPTISIMGGAKGYQTYLPVDGKLSKVRLNDGIHLTRTGGKIIARRLIKQLARTPGFRKKR